MRILRLSLATVAALTAAATWSSEITDLPQLTGTGIERGVASLRCAVPGTDIFRFSRGAVLEIGALARADVLLTTAHGLPASAAEAVRDCRIVANGREYAINDVWHAGGDSLGAEGDWAVVLADRIRGDLRRWRVAEVGDELRAKLVDEGARVRLVLRYADTDRETSCRLEPRALPPRLVAHTCATYPGMSGSPMILGIEHEPVVIGMVVGSGLEWSGWKIDMISVARPIDAPIIAAIVAATARAAQPPQRRRR
jgi:hypothetical protein